jgi:hypothetical protein
MILNRDEYESHLATLAAHHLSARTYPVTGVMATGTGWKFRFIVVEDFIAFPLLGLGMRPRVNRDAVREPVAVGLGPPFVGYAAVC